MIEKITTLSERISWDGTTKTTEETFEFLKDWLANHLKKHDKIYADYFKKIKVTK